ncbi:MAG: fibronectin type III domain-containing protein [Flavobacteriales bacterium]|nr:fibronectin type III domain-containing protein [Flavobacteriales bacterium]
MKASDLKLELSRLRAAQVYQLMRVVVTHMTGNPLFATPVVPLANMTTLADNLGLAIQAAVNGSRQDRLDRDALLEQAKALLNTQADYVRSQCAGHPAKLASSGYQLRRSPEPIGIPGQPDNLQARITGITGQLELRWESVRGAHGYQVWMTDKDPELHASWQSTGYTSRVTHLVTDLESYKAYWFCVSAIGAAGESAQSDPAMNRAA